jgi:polyhydroxyalkanoate synthesis regulator phasin
MPLIEELVREAYQDAFKGVAKTASAKVDFDKARKVTQTLNKFASLPYKPEAYEAICGIMKIASELFEEALSALEAETTKAAELEKVSEVRVLIDEMLERGLISKEDVQEKISALIKKSSHELEVVKEAVGLASTGSATNLFDGGQEKTASAEAPTKREMFEGCI